MLPSGSSFLDFLALARRKPNGFERSRKPRPVRTRVAVSFLFLAFLVGCPAWVYPSWLHQALKKMQTEAADQARKQIEAEARVVVCFFFCFLALARRKPNGFEKTQEAEACTYTCCRFLLVPGFPRRMSGMGIYIPRGFTRLSKRCKLKLPIRPGSKRKPRPVLPSRSSFLDFLVRRKPNGFERSRKPRPVRRRVAVSFLFLAFLAGYISLVASPGLFEEDAS